MGALRQPRINESLRKPPAAETRKLDRFGRDPESASELLRRQTDYAADTGYSPLYHAALADLPRLSSGATCYAFVLVVNMLSLGRARKSSAAPRESWTLPISAAELAELCRANVRDIQRQLSELKERGLIAVKTVKAGGVKYSVSLLYPKWREIEDYAVWKRRQAVFIDESDDAEESDDAPGEISKDAVVLTKRPQAVRPGRASRPVKVSVGVRELSVQNDSVAVDTLFSAVVTSGRLVVSVTSRKGESEAKGEDKGNAERHPCRALPTNEGIKIPPQKGVSHPRAAEVVNIFDPLLQRSGARLLSPDTVSLQSCCEAVGAVPHDFLRHWVMKPGGRASRPISGPRAVAAIIRECRANWEKLMAAAPAGPTEEERRAGALTRARAVLADPDTENAATLEWAREVIAELGG